MTHGGLFFLITSVVLTGLATSFGTGLFAVAYSGATQILPTELANFPSRVLLGCMVLFLAPPIALHTKAAVYHQFVPKGALMRRMWFGKRS